MDRGNRASVKDTSGQPRRATNTNANAGTSAGASNTANTAGDQNLATQQLQDRAITILGNNQLMLRYAIANDLVSASRVRRHARHVAAMRCTTCASWNLLTRLHHSLSQRCGYISRKSLLASNRHLLFGSGIYSMTESAG